MPEKSLKIAGFAGSLRRESINRLLLRSAISLAPDGMAIEELDIRDIPLFNGDLEEGGPPQPVIDFKESIAGADGLLIVTPEYNGGIPAVTKNLIDWASRRNPPVGNVLLDKPVSIMSLAGGRGTGVMSRAHVRDVLVGPRAIPMPWGDVGLSGGPSNFDEGGNLVDEAVRTQVQQNLVSFAQWIQKLSAIQK